MCVLKATKTLLSMQVINDREVESLNVLIALLTFISKLQPVGGQEIMLQTAYRQGSLLKTLWWCIQNRNEGYDAFLFISLWKWNFLGSRYFPVFKSHYSGNDFFGHVLWMGPQVSNWFYFAIILLPTRYERKWETGWTSKNSIFVAMTVFWTPIDPRNSCHSHFSKISTPFSYTPEKWEF